MALSNSFDYSLNVSGVIDEALENIGVKDGANSADIADVESAKRTLNLLLKAAQSKGLYIWTWKEASLPLVAATASYTLGTGGTAVDAGTVNAIQNPLEIADVRLRDSDSIDRELTLISISEYNSRADKTMASEPNDVCFQYGRDTSTLTAWPVPDAAAAAEYTIRFQYRKPFDDADSLEDDLVFPQKYLKWLVWQLSADICPKFRIALGERKYFEDKAIMAWDDVDDTELTSFFIEPNLGR